jgi:hypothetical protein
MDATDDGKDAMQKGEAPPSTARRRFTLEELLAGMTPESEHPLEDDGPQGEELI